MEFENDQDQEDAVILKSPEEEIQERQAVNKSWWGIIQRNKTITICIVFILSGSMNYGLTGFKLVLPFMLISLLFMLFKGWNNVLKLLLFFLAAFTWNTTLVYNPLVFPVVAGNIEIQKDGFMVSTTYEKNPHYRSEKSYDAYMKERETGLTIVSKVKKGDQLDVSYIIPKGGIESINGALIVTSVGIFSQEDFNNQEVNSQFSLVNEYIQNLDVLMYYPVLLIGLYVFFPYLSYFWPFFFFLIIPLCLWLLMKKYGNKEEDN